MAKNYFIDCVLLIVFLGLPCCSRAETVVNNPGSSSPDGLKIVSKQNLNLLVQGNEIEMAISTADKLAEGDGIKFVLKTLETDNLGFKHIRLEQRYKDLYVIGAECIVHINNRNAIYQINGVYLSDINVSIKPDINAEAALKIGFNEHKSKSGVQIVIEPSLVIYGKHLAFQYVVSYKDDEAGQWWYYIDAHTGKLIYRYNNIQHDVPVQ